ncbi:MAG: Mitochondrial inner membrane protein oxa1 [Claussenomyces sp. TS43310]|nr:MAG: Mitochondrial inner membrane protein oxa1 [Claussenomyces sp. TS43310]
MSSEPINLSESSMTIPSDSEQYSAQDDLSPSPPSSSSSPMILYSPPTIWGLLRGAAINLLLPFVNGLMLGFGELFAHEAAFRLGWGGTKFSSVPIRRGPASSTSLLAQHGASISGSSYRPCIAGASFVLRNAAARRFASTSPIPPNTSASTTDALSTSTSNPELASAAANGSLDSAMDLSSSSLLDIPEHIGYLKELGLDYGWGPTALVEWTLEHIHVFAGTPWWASIAITTVILRALMFKPYMDAADNAARLAACAPITKPMTEKMTELTRQGDTPGAMALRAEVQRVHKRAGIVMWKSFVPMLQMFAGYGTFVLLRGMGRLPVPGLETGGTLWFQNLALADPYFVLPLATAGILHWVLRKGGETGVNNMSPVVIKSLSYVLPGITLIFTAWLPSGLQLSFFISGLLSYLQSQIFRNPAFRARFGMQPLPEKPVDPFKKDAEPAPYQDRVIVVPKSGYSHNAGPTYEAPRSTSGLTLSGLRKEVSGVIDSGKKAAKETIKSGREMVGAGPKKDGKRTKVEIKAAEKYEEERRAEQKKQQFEADEKRRRSRLEKRNRGY